MKFLQTIKVDEFKKILASIPKIKTEEESVPLEESFNRVLFKDIRK